MCGIVAYVNVPKCIDAGATSIAKALSSNVCLEANSDLVHARAVVSEPLPFG